MAIFAVIEDSLVVNVIVANTQEIATEVSGLQCVNITDEQVGIGYSYVNGEFMPPVTEVIVSNTEPTIT